VDRWRCPRCTGSDRSLSPRSLISVGPGMGFWVTPSSLDCKRTSRRTKFGAKRLEFPIFAERIDSFLLLRAPCPTQHAPEQPRRPGSWSASSHCLRLAWSSSRRVVHCIGISARRRDMQINDFARMGLRRRTSRQRHVVWSKVIRSPKWGSASLNENSSKRRKGIRSPTQHAAGATFGRKAHTAKRRSSTRRS
jgi:hypothetical protein